MGQFFKITSVVNGVVLVDNRITVPNELRAAVLEYLHKDHLGQAVMIDAASYLWWPKLHRQIIDKAMQCDRCLQTGKNIKALQSHNQHFELPKLTEPNEEVQLDFAGPLYPDQKSNTCLLVAIDRFSKFPSAMVTNSTSSKKVIQISN